MKIMRRTHRCVVVIAAAAMVVVGCGSSSGQTVEGPATSSPASSVEGGELAGVRFETRRDPG